MYANVLPTSTLLRVWDAVLSGGGFNSLVAAALAILRRLAKQLKETEDIAGVYAVLADQTVPTGRGREPHAPRMPRLLF